MIGEQIHDFARELWPLNRSLTGEGTRHTLAKIRDHIGSLEIKSIPTGTNVFDWKIPKEWSVNEAFIRTPDGNKICEFSKNNLHLLGYSIPFKGTLPLAELKKHLYTLPEQPEAIPYITSYYKERWGFCISSNDLSNLKDGDYEVFIDTKLFDGCLNYGEVILPGKSNREIFLSTYICHPSMANNELSGPCVLTYIAKWLQSLESRSYTYRIVFIPETIGSIAYLSINHKQMKKNTIAGFNVSCIGDDRTYSYLPSRNGSTLSDLVAKHVLKWTYPDYDSYSWLDRGSDERQYCSPGIDLPIASLMRTKYGEYPEYHTSLDDLDNVVTREGLDGGYWIMRKALDVIERNNYYVSSVLCEPQMGKRGLYPTISTKDTKKQVGLMMDFISLCDGEKPLIEICEDLNVPAWDLYELIDQLISHKVIRKAEGKE